VHKPHLYLTLEDSEFEAPDRAAGSFPSPWARMFRARSFQQRILRSLKISE